MDVKIVDALNQIAKRMGATGWNFNAHACGDQIRPVERTDPERNITCNCRFENNTCHVIALDVHLNFSLQGNKAF
ncbi:probable LRR receptor-like serine/threonine-protein kinase At1g07650 [Hevea brasiliensis]|uniref:probable LRR receptor-like serine/threonine-protein kinase At1g07650 n=1 Tax=Hevea brasiliensis TaxID=3981 RepID=UPI0025F7A275|nr:probable LRR receptor-like serine/threonine-protein kinase At1g07650 [Hevea brasiliensis]